MRLIQICIISVILYGCSPKTTVNDFPTLTLTDLFDKERIVTLEEISNNIEIIPLESSDNIIIDHVRDVGLYEDKMIITHRDGYAIFDLQGNYLRSIGQQGQGPEEFHRVDKILWKNQQFYIFDYRQQKIITFNNNGNFIGSYKYGKRIDHVTMVNDSTFVGYIENGRGSEEIRLYFFDLYGNPIDSIKNAQIYDEFDFVFGLSIKNEFYSYKREIGFKEILCDTIYIINTDYTLKPKYKVESGEYNYTMDKVIQNLATNPPIFGKEKKITVLYENDRYLILNSSSERYHYFLYNKEEDKIERVKFQYNEEMAKNFNKEKEITYIEGEELILHDGSPTFRPFFVSDDGTKIIGHEKPLNEDDNPILVIATVKDKD